MPLYLEVETGANAGERLLVRAGATIGRRHADLVLDDAKVSGLHAVIELRSDGYYLVDTASANGIRVGTEKVTKVALVDGALIRVGRTEVRAVEHIEGLDTNAEASAKKQESWILVLQGLMKRGRSASTDEPVEALAFDPPLTLTFQRGRQKGLVKTLGFGPREAGSFCADIAIEDVGAPAVSFSLVPVGPGQAQFNTEHKALVRLNGFETESALISDGDLIDVANTRIELRMQKSQSRE